MDKLKTPCFILDAGRFRRNASSFKEALDSRFSESILAYSVKTNSSPALLPLVRECGCYAEVVSYTEYDLAIASGFSPEHIIYNGPLKSRETFISAIRGGSIVNIDTKRELDWLEEEADGREMRIGIRVNLNLMEISPEDCKTGEEFSRFGFSDQNGELAEAIARLRNIRGVRICGLHLHRTSLTRSLEVYGRIACYANEIVRKYELKPSYIDMGGGFFGDMPGKPSYREYTDVIADSLFSTELTIIVEPGNALVASAFSFRTQIIDEKMVSGVRILVCDGSRNDVDPFFHKKDYSKTFLCDFSGRCIERRQLVAGCTCLENDRLFELTGHPRLEVGDEMEFAATGAYTMALSPLFIRYFPRVYVIDDCGCRLYAEEWNEKDYLKIKNHGI